MVHTYLHQRDHDFHMFLDARPVFPIKADDKYGSDSLQLKRSMDEQNDRDRGRFNESALGNSFASFQVRWQI